MNVTARFSPKKLGTHNGRFHCDEAFGSYMLKLLYPGLEIVRTRDERLLAECDIVIDVGSVYDHGARRYDHHQKSFGHSMSTLAPGDARWTTKLSSAGLVYFHYGRDVLRKLIATDVPENHLNAIYGRVYETFVQEVDAIDNGIPVCDDGEPNYTVRTGLSDRVDRFNRKWNHVGAFDEQRAFERAVELIGSEFEETVLSSHRTWLPARSLVVDALDRRFDAHESGRVLELSSQCPWKEHYFSLEEQLGDDLSPRIDYVIFEDTSNGTWRVQSVPVSPESFVLRTPLPQSWRGLRDDELSETAGVEGCIFCHGTGFIGGNKTRRGAIEMAAKALETL